MKLKRPAHHNLDSTDLLDSSAPARSNRGFTLIELMLVMGIISVLMVISSLLLLNLIPRASLKSQTEILVSQVRSQQLKAMSGTAYNTEEPSIFGVYIEPQSYTLFRGLVYDPLAEDNYQMTVDEPIQLSTTFPSQQIIFAAGSGEILNFDPANSSITIHNTQNSESTVINFNQYGVITQ